MLGAESAVDRNLLVKLRRLVNEHNDKVVFVVRMGLLLLGWEVAFHFIWHNPAWLDAYNAMSLDVIGFILSCCAVILEFFQFEIEIESATRILRLKDTIGVTVGEPCIGYEVTALFAALIISFKGSPLRKLWFIPLGITIIYVLNLLRICALALLVTINQQIWELNHKLVFTVIVYSAIFLLWKLWLKLNLSDKISTSQ